MVDMQDGLWSTSRSYGEVTCPQGGFVYFHWTAAFHDLWQMASASHLASCDFTGATPLVPLNSARGDTATAVYYLPCENAGETMHLSCSVADHCSAGNQRVTVRVSPTVRVFDASSGELLIHSRSLARVYDLLGRRVDPSTGFTYYDRGFQTEAAANATLDMIWCLDSHCPSSALDAAPAATEASCRAEVAQLAGFIQRKRPTPRYDHALEYYHQALGHDASHCATLEYLAELHATRSNLTAATATAARLCAACGDDSPAARQAEAFFAIGGPAGTPAAPWPCLAPPPAGTARMHLVTTTMTIAGSVDDFEAQRPAFVEAFARAAAVDASRVQVTATAASVRLVVVVAAADAVDAAAIATALRRVTASAAAASSLLPVTVLTISDAVPSSKLVDLTPLPAADGGASPALIGGIVGGAVGLLLLLLLAYRFRCRAGRSAGVSHTKAKATDSKIQSAVNVCATSSTAEAMRESAQP